MTTPWNSFPDSVVISILSRVQSRALALLSIIETYYFLIGLMCMKAVKADGFPAALPRCIREIGTPFFSCTLIKEAWPLPRRVVSLFSMRLGNAIGKATDYSVEPCITDY